MTNCSTYSSIIKKPKLYQQSKNSSMKPCILKTLHDGLIINSIKNISLNVTKKSYTKTSSNQICNRLFTIFTAEDVLHIVNGNFTKQIY